MATLSLNTSITSSQKDDFYSVYDPAIGFHTIKSVYANYFSNDSNCPSTDWIWYQRIAESGVWKEFFRYCCNDYQYSPCYSSDHFDFIYPFYYNFNNTSDPDNMKPIDKIGVTFAGMRSESFINRMFVNINVKEDTTNKPLKDVEVYRGPVTDSTAFIIQRCSNECIPVAGCVTPPCQPDFMDITAELRNCNTSVQLMQKKKWYDVVIIGTPGIPSKDTFTISKAGVYTGTLHWQYWNGSDWKYFPAGTGGIIDNTNGFKKLGTNDVILPSVSDWQRLQIGGSPLYWHRAIYDSDLSVTTVPEASCFRWSGQYSFITDTNGNNLYTTLSYPAFTLDVIGKLPGYICKTGCGPYNIASGSQSLNVNILLIKSDLTCSLDCITPIYKSQTASMSVAANVSYGKINSSITITYPDQTIETTSSTTGPFGYTYRHKFTQLGLHKIDFSVTDEGGNRCSKVCYISVSEAPSCDVYTDQQTCEENGCQWISGKCMKEDPRIELDAIYTSIISGTVCISDTCIPTLDLNNDGKITVDDQNLAKQLTPDEAFSKILGYTICKDINPCIPTPPPPTGEKGTGAILAIIAALGAGYLLTRKKKE